MLQNAVATPADRAFAEHLASLATPARVVLDTNVWIDLLVFDDPVARPVREALVARRLTALMAPRCRDELAIVLTYPQFASHEIDNDAALGWVDMHTLPIGPMPASGDIAPAAPLPLCRDRDDQKFLEAARDGQAHWLVSKDKAVLKLRSRVARQFGFRIVTASAFASLLTAAA
ncbi:putative toxin-antitoxin system toxin component, PIN family [Pandoraea nosoerga]|uniref:Putative toxin-antitoxin system toxin component, PIN family n=1 Tax=Pandoraea nosoerga TaxID=2508296 RepID=A0A5E4TW68_9BURK|nr:MULTISPECIES: putative toxin-antitoxin system toxin component, PIN family [Pandoraea]MBN4664972.1 putative toxin-antitoxin system toxin component, PIN family [Pandoraea nosoerga]MBN4675312.1 putative toxin-antitoxin system toxin component, PIN family [Pandoraea nosoerga]MBN4680715.1 putative toxin-antitoxin system toxin component, PIN family [Pandoraea nosoerga]MBN4745901.1 putative toxin-antitoxin system toxin component, PIN family [Pandoraea nosoerga]VVD90834.1 putative toxin-antitoxin sy